MDKKKFWEALCNELFWMSFAFISGMNVARDTIPTTTTKKIGIIVIIIGTGCLIASTILRHQMKD